LRGCDAVTPINEAMMVRESKAEVESHIPWVGQELQEMAAAVAFLASDEAAYITGQTLLLTVA